MGMNETPPDGICLAEYCHLFDVCEKPEESETFKVQKKSATLQESAKYHYKKHKKHRKHKFLKTCNNATMDKAKKLCYDTMYKCLPFENEATRQLSVSSRGTSAVPWIASCARSISSMILSPYLCWSICSGCWHLAGLPSLLLCQSSGTVKRS